MTYIASIKNYLTDITYILGNKNAKIEKIIPLMIKSYNIYKTLEPLYFLLQFGIKKGKDNQILEIIRNHVDSIYIKQPPLNSLLLYKKEHYDAPFGTYSTN